MKTLNYSILSAFYIPSFLRVLNSSPKVIFWHGIDLIHDKQVDGECVNSDVFEKQIKYLKKHFNIIAIDELKKTDTFTKRDIVITFDDGFKNNLDIAAPILEKHKIPFTVFISTHNISTGNLFPTSISRLIILKSNANKIEILTLGIDKVVNNNGEREALSKQVESKLKTIPVDQVRKAIDELVNNLSINEYQILKNRYTSLLPMNWDEVKQLSKIEGCTIGSHCVDHICCHENQENEIIVHQLRESKNIIEKKIGKPCNFIAFPNGDYTEFSRKAALELGYSMAFTTEKNKIITKNLDFSAIPRMGAPRDLPRFKFFVNFNMNKMAGKLQRLPKNLKKKISNILKWFILKISMFCPLNAFSERIRPLLWKITGVNINGKIKIGYDVYYDVANSSLINIEEGVWITSRSLLLCHKRMSKYYSYGDDYNALPYEKKPITLKKGCCIGMGSIIMPGVTVGEGAIVGAGSVVSKDVPDWSIVVGNPAKVVKKIDKFSL
jgi:acetyltransferase-like isoleucine patch superfamily enzyme